MVTTVHLSDERLTDHALRQSYLETFYFLKFLQSLASSILILEDNSETIFLFFLYYHRVVIFSAERFISVEFIGSFLYLVVLQSSHSPIYNPGV